MATPRIQSAVSPALTSGGVIASQDLHVNRKACNASALAGNGDTYRIFDYHLNGVSPCVDAGDPDSVWTAEPKPNGGRVNMGAYGNTTDASITPYDGSLFMVF